MSNDTKSMHITPVGGNVFADLEFEPEEAAALQAESQSQRIISEKLTIKLRLMSEITCDEIKLKPAKQRLNLSERPASTPNGSECVAGWDEMPAVGKEL